MPKTVFVSTNSNETIGVHWYNFPDRGEDPILPEVAVSIGEGMPFAFVDDTETTYNRLYFGFDSPEKIDKFIKELHRAKRKVFGGGKE